MEKFDLTLQDKIESATERHSKKMQNWVRDILEFHREKIVGSEVAPVWQYLKDPTTDSDIVTVRLGSKVLGQKRFKWPTRLG